MMRLPLHTFLTLHGVVQAPVRPDEDRDGGFERGSWACPPNHHEPGDPIANPLNGLPN